MTAKLLFAALVLVALAGCTSTGVSAQDQANMQKEFSKENYEKAMKDAGREAELEAEKKKEAEFMKGNSQPEGQE